MSHADLSGAKLNRIKLLESDLPKWTEPLKTAKNKLVDPIVCAIKNYAPIINRKYNPETNRMDLPAD